MPIKSADRKNPPVRVRDEAGLAAQAELKPFLDDAILTRDGYVQVAEDGTETTFEPSDGYTEIILESEDEAKLYAAQFHLLTKAAGRLANVRTFGETIYVRVKPADAIPVTRPRKPVEDGDGATVEEPPVTRAPRRNRQ